MEAIWKVLIADDEPIIREGIREAVDWPALGMEVIAEAEDGEEALELALAHEAHILLVDLNMPIMNGMTLMKRVRERLPGSKIVIITGHDEFAYAQEAIRLQVEDYILKPANPEQLTRVMAHVRGRLESEAKQSEYLKMASEQITKNFSLIRERFCLEWIEGNLTDAEIVEQLQFLGLPAVAPDMIVVVRWPEGSGNRAVWKESDRQLFLFAIENIVAELLAPYRNAMFRDAAGWIVVSLWGKAPETLFAGIEQAVRSYLNISVQLQFQETNGGLTDIAAVYRECKQNVYQESRLSPIVRRAYRHIRESYADREFSLEALACSLQVSPVYLSRIIRQELGTSFVNLLTQMRMEKAVRLLNASDLQINEIAELVGYDTQHYFSTAFKKAIGVSPNRYRRGAAFCDDDPEKAT
ncbi:response regulator [Paenibacillus sp. MSJ-34]|uniref:response regulator transcription factor n=1 Tax=Paenibacillus sp. MSJ-34 TaxID=2841529 RepID=UPI001C1026EF|nr:response regulator [Paenibacillus sp. MSJ-34]MBU5445024.1 response regulator [Paenibacillus sp. MSJ-34]